MTGRRMSEYTLFFRVGLFRVGLWVIRCTLQMLSEKHAGLHVKRVTLHQFQPNFVNLLTPNVNYSGRTAPLTSKVAFYIFIQQI